MEIYGMRLPERYNNVRFSDAAMDVYRHFGVTLFAVKIQLRRAVGTSDRYVRTDGVVGRRQRRGSRGLNRGPTQTPSSTHHGRLARGVSTAAADDHSHATWDSFGNVVRGVDPWLSLCVRAVAVVGHTHATLTPTHVSLWVACSRVSR